MEKIIDENIDFASTIVVHDDAFPDEKAPAYTDHRIDRLLIPAKIIHKRTRVLAEQICRDYRQTDILHAVVLLKGAFVFAADLGREIYKCDGPELKYDFIKPVTYGTAIKSRGESQRKVRIDYALEDLNSDHVLVIEDIVDQAFTLSAVQRYLQEEKQVASVKFCVLLEKMLSHPTPEVQQLRESLTLDYVGFRIPDRWVAGFGIDAGEDFRHLPDIVTVNEEYYRK